MADTATMKFPFWKKLIGVSLLLVYFVSSTWVFVKALANTSTEDDRMTEHDITMLDSEKNSIRVCLFILAMASEIAATTMCLKMAISNYCIKQYVNCGSQTLFVASTATYLIIFGLILLWKGLCSPLECHLFLNRLIDYTIFFTIANFGCLLAVCSFHKLFCKCKTCNRIKDVRFTYLDEFVEVIEDQKITLQFLLEQFRIVLRDDETLSILGINVHTFYNYNETFSFVPGTYVVKLRKLDKKVKISYLNSTKMISEKTRFNEQQLKAWLNIDTHGLLAIESQDGEIVYTFHQKNKAITLKEGNYVVKIFNLESCQEQSTSVARTVVNDTECTMLAVD